MSKKTEKSEKVAETTEAPEAAPVESAPAETVPAPAAEAPAAATEIVVAAPAAIITQAEPEYPAVLDTQVEFDPYGPYAKLILLKRFPHATKSLQRYVAVTPERVMQVIEELPEPFRANMIAAFERMNPDTTGMHLARERAMQFFDAKLNQGTGNDQQRPETAPQGGYYSRDERILSAGSAAMAKAMNLPQAFEVYVVGVVEGRSLWEPKKKDGEPDDNASKLPLCSSLDQKRGSAYGVCEACAYKPVYDKNAPKPELACTNEIQFYVVPADFSGVYRMRFSKTAMATARMLVKKFQSGGWKSLWSRRVSFTSKIEVSKTDSTIKWYEPVATIGEDHTPENLSSALRVFSQLVETIEVWPSMRRIYNLSDNPKTPETPSTNVTDGSALAAGLGIGSGPTPKLPDLSAAAPKVNV